MGNNLGKLEEYHITGSMICELTDNNVTYPHDRNFIMFTFSDEIKSECFDILNKINSKFVVRTIWHHNYKVLCIKNENGIVFMDKLVSPTTFGYAIDNKYL